MSVKRTFLSFIPLFFFILQEKTLLLLYINTLYKDENINYNYEKGSFSNIPMTYSEAKKQLIIGDRQGSFMGMLTNRTFNIVKAGKDKNQVLDFNAAPAKSVAYNGKSITINLP